MLKIGPKYIKLKTSLQIAITRLKYLQSHKLELSERVKLEIVKCIQNSKYMQAKIKAQRFLRNEATVEALELVEMYCEQLLERYDLFQQMKKPDESLIVPVSSLIWVTPYYQTEVGELKVVMKQLAAKYGNNFCRMALSNREGNASPELIERVKLFVSTDEKTEKCLKKICRKFNIDYKENKICSTRETSDKPKDFDLSGETKEEGTPQDSSEYQASGSHNIDESLSSKKAFMAMMSKLKIKKKSKKNKSCKSKQASRSNVILSPATEASSHKSGSLNDKIMEAEEKLNDSVVNYENISNRTTSDAEKNSSKCSKNEFSNDPNTISLSMPPSMLVGNFTQMYTEPPPPYNYQYADGISKDLERSTCNCRNTFQFPSCPELSDFQPEKLSRTQAKPPRKN